MIIGDNMIFQEKDVLTGMLYNQKAILVWDFTKISKVKKEIAFLQKIQIIDCKI